MRKARKLAKKTGETAQLYGEVEYQAGSWKSPRRVIVKAEVVAYPDREAQRRSSFRRHQHASIAQVDLQAFLLRPG